MNLLDMYVRPIYREVIRINLKVDQEFLASRAARQGNNIQALVHRWNVVELENEDSFKTLSKQWDDEFTSTFFVPDSHADIEINNR